MKELVKVNKKARDTQVQILALERIHFYLLVCCTQMQFPITFVYF